MTEFIIAQILRTFQYDLAKIGAKVFAGGSKLIKLSSLTFLVALIQIPLHPLTEASGVTLFSGIVAIANTVLSLGVFLAAVSLAYGYGALNNKIVEGAKDTASMAKEIAALQGLVTQLRIDVRGLQVK